MTTITFRVTSEFAAGYSAFAIGHDIHTQADTLLELDAAAHLAAHLHFERPVRVILHPIPPEFIEEQMTICSVCSPVRLPGEHPYPTSGAFEDFDRELTYDGSFW